MSPRPKTRERRKLYTFAIDADLAAALKRLKAQDGIPESETIRRAVRSHLKREGVLPEVRPTPAVLQEIRRQLDADERAFVRRVVADVRAEAAAARPIRKPRKERSR